VRSGRIRKDSQSVRAEELVEKLEASDKAQLIIFDYSSLGSTSRVGLVFDRESDTDDAVWVPVEAQRRSVHSSGILRFGNS